MELELNRTYYLVDSDGTLYSTSFFYSNGEDYHFKIMDVEYTIVEHKSMYSNGFLSLGYDYVTDRLVDVTNPNMLAKIFKFKSNAAEKVLSIFESNKRRMDDISTELTKEINIDKLINKI